MANVLYSKEAFLAPLANKVIHRWCVALSGGVDSVVLLHFLRYTLDSSVPIIAIHVNHHLQASASAWQDFCRDMCRRWDIPLHVADVQIPKGGSVEANARRLRYEAIFSRLTAGDVLLTAHHEDDQAETVLLQLLRGAGLKGLAAMPQQMANEAGVIHYRPFLTLTRAEIEAYAQSNQLEHIHDLSNDDIAYDRNYLRQLVIPVLRQRWPSYARTLARSAQLSAQLLHWIEPLWQATLAQCRIEQSNCLDQNKLTALPPYECSEVVRLWLEDLGLPLPTEAQMHQVLKLVYRRRGKVAWHNVILTSYQNRLYALSAEEIKSRRGEFHWPENENRLCIDGIVLRRDKILGQGLAVANLADCVIRFRTPGERFHAAGRVGSHPLKKLFQEWGVPPWQRARIPLIYIQDELVAVVGYAYHARKLAATNEMGVVFNEESGM
ncbi:MAG: tilS [Gammaproteobacteria bacterium]|jgi:tRNA(Ile)-lysidine synthase|nr:tilS [Gammaproteobacteria bacterium]